MSISIRKLKQELEKIDFKLTDKEEGYYGNDLVKTYIFSYGEIEIEYNIYDNVDKSYFAVRSPSVKFKTDEVDTGDLDEEIDNATHLLQALKILKKVLS